MKVKAAGIFVVRKDKKLLVCHPTNHKSNFWSIPKGKVEDDDSSYLEAALRETYEETNLNLYDTKDFDIHFLSQVDYAHRKKVLFPFLYLEKETSKFDWSSVELKCNSNVPIERGGFPEMDDFKFCELDEAEDILHVTQSFCVDKIKEIIQNAT